MFTWILIILYSSLCASDPSYECGPHGKFEYCIDGIPGCVIGCHCHPGYYFDTDTKICEPNIKLSQDYRRHFMPMEPTRVHNIQDITLPPIATEMTTKDVIDAKLDEITNDADDLGDWLYNQFFKTIENQVINKTNDNDKQMLTRRSGVQIKKPVRRSHKHMRSKKSKKPKKNNLKSKLLRITEDDSLFRSSSESGDDSSDNSASSDTDTDTSDDDSRGSRGGRKKDKDRNNGHRKIVIFNKKPRPPLPSFIFLPNMDTPFFPPIGLPPPPVPMYPMIPVPPVVGPMYPYPPPPGPQVMPEPNNVTNGETTTTVKSAPDTEKPQPEPENPPEQDDKDPANVEEDSPNVPDTNNTLRSGPRYRTGVRSGTMQASLKNMKSKHKLLQLQKLRQKMMRRKKIDNYLAERQMEPDIAAMEENLPANEIPSSDPMKVNLERPQSVDFKYLTELIHKIDPNGTARGNLVNALAQKPVPAPLSAGVSAGAIDRRTKYNLGQVTNQASNQLQNTMVTNNSRRQKNNMDDSYYADLGQQIASMIKNIDMKDNHHIDVEIERNRETPILHPVFNENNYGARSYWERSVRSPVKNVKSQNENYSEEHLFNLENEVETAASTLRTLDLHELETIIFNMNQPKNAEKKTLHHHLKNIVIEPARVMFNLDNVISKNNISNLTKMTTETPENSRKRSTLKSILYPDVFIGSNMRNFNQLTTLEPQVIFNNPYVFQPTRKLNEIPVIQSTFEQTKYSLDQSRFNKNQYKYNTDQLNYYPEQSKYHNLEQLKYNMEQARYQNNQLPLNFPIPVPSSKFRGHNPFVNSYTNDFNMTKIRYNIKPPSYNLSPNIYYYSPNNKNSYVFEKPALPNLQSLSRKTKPFIKKFEPYSFFQHQFQQQFDNEDDF